MKRVAFIINFNPKKWLGGFNYIYNLLHFLKEYKVNSIKPIIITNNKKYFKKPYNLRGVKILETKILNKNNFIISIFHKFLIILFGKNFLLEKFLTTNKIHAISHFEFTGHRSKIKSYPWFPDFQEVFLPDNFSLKQRVLRSLNLYLAYKNSSKIIISSKSVMNDLRKKNKRYLKKALLLKHAVNIEKFVSFSKSQKILDKYKIQKKFYYLPNHFWKHKNHIIVLKALKFLIKKNNDFIVVTSGNFSDERDIEHSKFLKNYIKRYKLEKYFIHIGIIPFQDVVALMLRSIALINPSLSEGWSNTVEQAKALGKKVIVSDIPTHQEQKDANFYFFKKNSYTHLAKLLSYHSKNSKKIKNFSKNLKKYKEYKELQKVFIYNFKEIFFSA